MDPDTLVLEISSDEDGDWNDHGRGVSDDGDDCNWFAELFGDGDKENHGGDSDAVVVVSESVKPVKKSKSLVKLDDDDDDDCMVLDNDPNEAVEVRNDDRSNDEDDSDDVLVVSEKGQVACRDYPHSRHLCIKFPFASTPNQTHCNQCYCYVCDSRAPCVYWGDGAATTDHCHATDKDKFWILERKNTKKGCKVVQPLTQPPPVDLHTPPPALAQAQIPNLGLTYAHHTSANFQYSNNVRASRTKLRPNLAAQLVLRAHRLYNSRVHRPVFKRTASVGLATPANQNPYRANFGNLSRQQSYQVNVNSNPFPRTTNRLAVPPLPFRPSQPASSQPSHTLPAQPIYPVPAKTGVDSPVSDFSHHSSQGNQAESATVNSGFKDCNPQPLLVSNHSNPSFPSYINSNQFPRTTPYHHRHPVPPSPFRPQPASSQPSYTVPAQPSHHPMTPVSDLTHHSTRGNQAAGPTADSGVKDCGLGLFTSQDSATLGGGLGDYKYDWIFDEQPIEPGFTDYSSDSAFIDTGPIFEF